MQTRIRDLIDTKTLEPIYAVQVKLKGKEWSWLVGDDNRMSTHASRDSAETERAEVKKRARSLSK